MATETISKPRRPKHRARPSFVTRRRNRQAEIEHHMWAAQGLERPTYRGKHTAEVA